MKKLSVIVKEYEKLMNKFGYKYNLDNVDKDNIVEVKKEVQRQWDECDEFANEFEKILDMFE